MNGRGAIGIVFVFVALVVSACSLDLGALLGDEGAGDSVAEPLAPKPPEIQLDFPDVGAPEPEPKEPSESRVRVLYRDAQDAEVQLVGVDVGSKEAWLLLERPGALWELHRVALDTGRRMERWRADANGLARRRSPQELFSPVSGGLEGDLERFGGILARVGLGGARRPSSESAGVVVDERGQVLVYGATERGKERLRLVEGGRPGAGVTLGAGLDLNHRPNLSPDGRSLAWSASRRCSAGERRSGSCLEQLALGSLRDAPRLVSDALEPGLPIWAPASDRVYVAASRDGRRCALEIEAASGSARPLVCAGPSARLTPVGLTSAGRRLLVTAEEGGRARALWVRLSGAEVEAEQALGPIEPGLPSLVSADGELLFLAGGAKPGRARLVLLDALGRRGSVELVAERAGASVASFVNSRWVNDELIVVRWSSEASFEVVGVKLEPYALRTLGDYRE